MPIIARINGFAVRDVVLDLEIEFDENGYILFGRSRDGSVYSETWHNSYDEAVQAATEQFGVEPSRWVKPEWSR